MSIVFNCGGCGHRFRVDTALAGKRFRCKQCNLVAAVPAGDGGRGPSSSVIDPFGLEEKAAPRARRSDDGDGLLGEAPVAPTFHPSPAANVPDAEVNPTRGVPALHRKRKEFSESPVLGVPVETAPWAFLGALALLDFVHMLFGGGLSGRGLTVGLIFLILHLVGVAINGLVILLASRVLDAEVTSIRRVMSIALALAAGSSAASLSLRVVSVRSPVADIALNLVVTGSILAATLQLGCLGVIGFMLVTSAIYAGLFVFLISLLTNL